VLTQTRPWPAPCAGAFVAGSVTAGFAGTGLAAAEPADADVLGLNKSRSVNLLGDADGAGAGLAAELAATSVSAFLRLRFSAGDAEAAAGLSSAAGEAAAVASAFFCARRSPGGDAVGDSAVEGNAVSSAGEAVASAGDSAGEGDAASSAGEAVASAFLCARCFAGDGDVSGDPPGTSN
jgi:hypothetical protein